MLRLENFAGRLLVKSREAALQEWDMNWIWLGCEWDMIGIWIRYELDMNGIWIGNELDMNGIWIGWSALTWSSNLDVLLYKIPSEPRGSRNASNATLSRCRIILGGRSKFHAAARRWLMGLLHREPHRWKNWRQGVLTFPICSCLESILKGTNLASVWIWRDEAGVLSNSLHIVLHQKKLLPTRCTYVSCGPLVLVVFENPSASLDLSNAIVDKVNAEAPTCALSS